MIGGIEKRRHHAKPGPRLDPTRLHCKGGRADLQPGLSGVIALHLKTAILLEIAAERKSRPAYKGHRWHEHVGFKGKLAGGAISASKIGHQSLAGRVSHNALPRLCGQTETRYISAATPSQSSRDRAAAACFLCVTQRCRGGPFWGLVCAPQGRRAACVDWPALVRATLFHIARVLRV